MLFTTRTLLHKNYIWALRERRFFSRYRPVADDEPIPLTAVLAVNGINDAAWCLCATTKPTESDQFVQMLAADFAEHVLPIFEAKFPDNPAPRRAIETVRRFARGEATKQELANAYKAVRAADVAADVAHARAAYYAAEAASHAAYTATYVAYTADRFARLAARGASAYAANAAYYATEAAVDARAAAAEAERLWQTDHFREALLAHN